ncbi:MAG: SAM-dependent chlorinase/fluorinase [Dehalococcoidia bacterium]|nr:SAM-dependent chlorinase/fluorinase [Dehalococcoidia bacterium]MDP7240895.1 SAM-dependent chlorinase/fluorinase [Dehalococcoidia bacterium]
MKGVILGINHQATLVDISDRVGPQDIQDGVFVLAAVCPYFPPGTVGAGRQRRFTSTGQRPAGLGVGREQLLGVGAYRALLLGSGGIGYLQRKEYLRPSL